MRLKSLKLIAAFGVMLSASLMMSPVAKAADGPASGEGFYAGLFVGYGTGVTQADVSTKVTSQTLTASVFETERGGVALSGIQGGGWFGWGLKTADDLYFGVEIEGAGSEEQVELTSTVGVQDPGGSGTITSIKVQRQWQSGAAVRVGYYINETTLLALKGGFSASAFKVDVGSTNETFYGGGPQVGASVESKLSKLDPNLSLRMEWVYTDYLTADIGGIEGVGNGTTGDAATEITGSDSVGRIGITYSF